MSDAASKPATVPPKMNGAAEAAELRDYAFLGFLVCINIMNFIDRQLLASFANFVVPDLGLSNTQFGLLTGFAFIVFYSVMGIFMGALADRLHRPRLLAAGLALWSLLTAASGRATNFVSLLVPRMLIGVGESVATPTSISMLADRFPPRQMGFAAGIYYMGVPAGVALSLLIAGYLGPTIGWRNCFYLLGGIGIGFALVLLLIPETARRGVALTAEGRIETRPLREMVGLLWRALRLSPALSATIAGGVVVHFALGAAAFDQLWFVQERGFERADIAVRSGWIAAVGGVLGTFFGGISSDWWQTRFQSGRPMFLAVTLTLLLPFNFAYRIFPGDHILFWVGLFFAFIQLGMFYGPTFATVQDLAPARVRATAIAFYILLLNMVGLGVGITFGGIAIDYLIAAEVAEPYTKTLLAFTILSSFAIPLLYIGGKYYHRDKAQLSGLLGEKDA